MTEYIKLNFINRSRDANNSQIILFQKNIATGFSELAYAWMVIENCGIGDYHPFKYSDKMQLCISDSYGNYTPFIHATSGEQYQAHLSQSGDQLSYLGEASNPNELQVLNNLGVGAINVCVFKNKSLLSMKTNVAPGQMATFRFNPTLWIGVASQVVEGTALDSAILKQKNTELSLLGVASADIVMTGGGPGRTSTPFRFGLENVVMG